ncbi:blast:Transmembrane GTPase fzo [Drosophila guanche]|uniref:Blast:Transmembrane GTPase fzo n=1 Tax=Drosophila guanche TaxID=7266 RepID=A0A3B0JHD2_DROGU|nr:blast:Transmembrane GTPase fzo [Drosophila guanche]
MCDSDSSDSCISSLLSSRTSRSSSSSRLSEFTDARTELQNIYRDMGRHLGTMMSTLRDCPLMEEGSMEQLQGCKRKVEAIDKVLMRKRMKVAFFGRTSNGKSAVINAMLHQRILPSAMGHTTSCFCQVQATAGVAEQEHVRIEAKEQRLELTCLPDLASAHSPRSLPPRTLLHVNMPRSRCPLLDHDVVLMDTPGVDVTAQMDDCIDRYCLDADVFVLVLNAESTMSRVERQFFKGVAQKLSRPNLFILNNRWDMASSQEPDMEHLVREQHEERCLQLLVEELGVYAKEDMAEARSRIYHVSALETLQLRMGTKEDPSAASQQRLEEFLRFEADFAACLAQAALKTKFEKHLLSAKEMLANLSEQLLVPLQNTLQEKARRDDLQRSMLSSELDSLTIEHEERKVEFFASVQELYNETYALGHQVIVEQIEQLPAEVHSFALQPFHPQLPRQLDHYQRSLSAHLEEVLTEQMIERMARPLQSKVSLLERQVMSETTPWEPIFRIDCEAFMESFQPDLNFHFRWGVCRMWSRIRGIVALPLPEQTLRRPQQNGRTRTTFAVPIINRSQWQTLRSLLCSEGTAGAVLLAGVVSRSINWRMILGLGSALAAIYFYELLHWTPAAQERTFKAQYSEFLQRQLRAGVTHMNTQFGQQIWQHLMVAARHLNAQAEQDIQELRSQIKEMFERIESNNELHLKLREFRTKATLLEDRLNAFQSLYMGSRI